MDLAALPLLSASSGSHPLGATASLCGDANVATPDGSQGARKKTGSFADELQVLVGVTAPVNPTICVVENDLPQVSVAPPSNAEHDAATTAASLPVAAPEQTLPSAGVRRLEPPQADPVVLAPALPPSSPLPAGMDPAHAALPPEEQNGIRWVPPPEFKLGHPQVHPHIRWVPPPVFKLGHPAVAPAIEQHGQTLPRESTVLAEQAVRIGQLASVLPLAPREEPEAPASEASAAHPEFATAATTVSTSSPTNQVQPMQHSLPISEQLHSAIVTGTDELSHSGRTEITLRLDPPELGRVRIHLTGTDDYVTGRVLARDEATRVLLDAQVQALRERLLDAGISLGRFDVAREGAGNNAWDDREQPGVPRHRRDSASRPISRTPRLELTESVPRGLVDYLA